MNKNLFYAGADVSADWIDAARQMAGGQVEHRRFPNEPNGHQELTDWLGEAGQTAKVILGLATVNRLHIQGVAEHEGDTLTLA